MGCPHACMQGGAPRPCDETLCPLVSQGKEFIRIGYYVNVEYLDAELKENPPEVPVVSALSRTILTDHPRVTRFAVDFDNDTAVPAAQDEQTMAVDEGQAFQAEGAMVC